MKKKSLSILFVSLVMILIVSVMAMPALAGPPEDVSGDWYYLPSELPTTTKVAGGNAFMTIVDTGYFTGSFVGNEADIGEVIINRNGIWLYWGEVSFETVTVADKTGGLEMVVFGRRPDALSEWVGTWRITGGTGDLQGVHGQGAWDGPGWQGNPEVHGIVSYSGKIHFEPN